MADYDIVVIGSGPGGYVAAIRAAQLGMKTAIVERSDVGGVCLNWGCIPSKALLRNAEVVSLFRRASDFGITAENIQYDFGQAIDRSRQVVSSLTGGIRFLLKKNNVEYIDGLGKFKTPNQIEVLGDSSRVLDTENVLLATGSRFRPVPQLDIDGEVVISSRQALEMREVPKKVVIVGGGATGVEFAYLYRMYGSEVTIVEMLPRLVPLEDEEISKHLERSFQKQGIQSMTGAKVESLDIGTDEAVVTVSDANGATDLQCDKVLVAVGMQGNIEEIGLEDIGVITERGFVSVNEHMETNIAGVFAIGDVTGKLLLAHVASAQGVLAVESIAGMEPPVLDYDLIPRATYCHPQIASFGLTEKQALDRGLKVRVGQFPFSASGKAIALGDTDGMVKIVVDDELGDILGAHMIGSEVTELLGEIGLAKMLESTTKELGWLVHPHPTISEMVKEAALAAEGEAIHI